MVPPAVASDHDAGATPRDLAAYLAALGIDAPIVVERVLGRALDAAVAAADGGPLYALPTYTALLELRDVLADRGVAGRWSE